jgi:DNA-directed RNA polymerase subunit B
LINLEISNDDVLLLQQSFFKEKGLVRQHLDSFNEFVDVGLQGIVDEVGEIEISVPENPFRIKFGHIRILDPVSKISGPYATEVDGTKHEIYPTESRFRNLTYTTSLSLEMTPIVDGREWETELVPIGDLPVMLKSKLCPLSQLPSEMLINYGEDFSDPGGYFIINGSERVIVALEDIAPNFIISDIDTRGAKPVYETKVFSTTVGFRARIQLRIKSDNAIYVSMPGVPTELPFVVVMRALGLESDREIAEAVSPNKDIQNQLEATFEKTTGIDTSGDAVLYIGNRVAHGQTEEYRRRRAENVIDRNFLPHIGRTSEKRIEKSFFLGEMACRAIELKVGKRDPDDKDHFRNKRLKLAGPLLSDLFRIAFRNLCRDIKYQLEQMGIKRRRIAVSAAVRPGIVSDRLKHALATGNWGRGRVGVTQLLDRTNHISALSHLRRVQSPLSRSQPNFEARDLHPTHWGRLCPNETPEGSNCGLVKNLALQACVSVGIDSERVKQLLYHLGVIPVEDTTINIRISDVKVFLNGSIIGYCSSPRELVNEIRKKRRSGEIPSEINVVLSESRSDRRGIFVNCDAGRTLRPLINVENGISKLLPKHIDKLRSREWNWEDLIKEGIIEYLDADEEENALITLNINKIKSENTHTELAPYNILGICATLIPYPEHNQSPRNSYEAGMAKQALGIHAANFLYRVDSRSHLLHYPQKPMVKTKTMDLIGYNNRPSGQNCVVALISFEGYNMEDALIFNKASIERGLGRSTFSRIYTAECRQYLGGLKDKFISPEPGIRGYRGEQYYRFLDGDGIISLGSDVAGGDVLLGRTSPPRFLEEYKEFEVKGPTMRDTSIDMRPSETGIVDDVFITETSDGSKLVKVRVRDQRIPELGDKFASRHGQKGVIGAIVPQEDLPFSSEGIVPDIIINPHAIPSRMTIGQFLESIAGKISALIGKEIDGTPFINEKPEELKEMLKNYGFSHTGREVLYNGISGEKLLVDIFIGLVYYQKLHHMVRDKIHARARGQVQMLTRQPTEGRTRGGGLRFGEMERDCLLGHGAAMLLRDRLLEESDKYHLYLCEECGYIAYYDLRQRKYTCQLCEEKAEVSPVIVSYAFKLLLQELMSLGISPRLKLKERG